MSTNTMKAASLTIAEGKDNLAERAKPALADGLEKYGERLLKEATLAFYDGISEQEIDKALIQAAAQNIKDDIAYDRLAARLQLLAVYREVLGTDDFESAGSMMRVRFAEYLENGIKGGLLSEKMRRYDWTRLAAALRPENDLLFTNTGISTLMRRYALRAEAQHLMEVPQYIWMRVAMGLAWNEAEPNEVAISFYEKMSALEYIPGGSTNINAGAVKSRLSNCFLMGMEDNVDHIGKTVSDVLKLSKATGGIGLSVTKLRASGSPISTNNTFSSGPIPFLHIIDSAIRAISRAGKKMGALCFYMENWHLDFQEYMDLKQNAGDDYRRTRTADTAVYISDEFMKRVEADDFWYLFDPKETPDLIDLYGAQFSKRYQEYVALAEAGKMRIFKKMKAREQFRSIIVSLQAASHPWITWKDTINVRALNNNTGTINGSNLCTEITLPVNEKNIAVCNIMSINLARHLNTDSSVDWEKLKDSVTLGIRQLDNLVDINEPPVAEAINFDSHNRAIGLGVMGLAEIFERRGFAYDSPEAYNLADEVMEFVSYHAISASADLAVERGEYDNFAGSGWSKGYVPYDTIDILEKERGERVLVDRSFKLDWEALRARVKQGMRNATLLAIAPTANIGLVAGTSTGIDPRFAQIFSRNTLGGKYLELNFNLVVELEKLGIWDEVKGDILASYGNLESIEKIPAELKAMYKDSFSVKPEGFVEVAARAQKWVDQAISRNMYLETRDTDEIMGIYIRAWQQGLKTTYYLHMKPRHNAEQSTLKVNKSNALGKKGFGAAMATAAAVAPTAAPVETAHVACPVDPQERAQCDSCQ
ncbi:MAG: ribonucleoside-diphosphate reductase subunit alpha [bacterium]|nr:ribonucleoside-diphosphate reductase subunit alpha [bacterium]